MADYLSKTGLQYYHNRIKNEFASASSLSDLADRVEEIIAEGGEPNVIEVVKVNNSPLTPDANKAVNVTVPTDLSELTNTGNDPYATEGYVDQNGGKIDVIKVNGTTQTITNKAVDISVPVSSSDLSDGSTIAHDSDIPTAVSDLTNDGDGTSPFATQAYVATNGGKIDVIKVNGTTQTITNKEVNITVPTSSSDLSDGATIVHTSDLPTDLSDLTNTGSDPYAQMSDVESAVVGALKPKGTVAFASLPQLTATNLNSMYNVSDAFTTTADFVEGAGVAYPAGTNVAIINTGTDANPIYKYDAMVGVTDLSGYWAKSELVAITTAEIDTIIDGQ